MAQATTLTAGRLSATFAALQHPNYRRWFVGQVLSLMGTWMQSVAQGWLVYEMTGSKLALGAIAFAGSIPSLFVMLPAGVLADRIPKRRVLVFSQAAMMACAFVLALLAALQILQVWQIGLLAFLLGVANAVDAPARLAFVPELVEDRRDLQNAIALNSTMFNLGRVVGPAIGGLVLAGMGAAWCFALNGASFLAVLIALLSMRFPQPPAGPASVRRLTAEIGDGLGYAWRQPVVRTLILLIGVTSLFGFSYTVLLPAYAADVLKVGETGYGLLNAAAGLGALIGSLVVAALSRSHFRGRQLTFGSILFPAALLALAAVRTLPLALGCLLLAGLGFVSQNATCNTIVQTLVPDELRGRVMSVYALLFFGAMPVGSLLSGGIAQALGPAPAIALCASASLAFALGVYAFIPAVRKA